MRAHSIGQPQDTRPYRFVHPRNVEEDQFAVLDVGDDLFAVCSQSWKLRSKTSVAVIDD